MRAVLTRHAAAAALAAIVLWMAAHHSAYAPREWGVVGLLLGAWVAVTVARRRLPHPSTNAGLAVALGGALAAWTACSLVWADFSRHMAWEETGRTLLYVLALATGAAACKALADTRRIAHWLGWTLGALVVLTGARAAFADDPLSLLVGGRLEWPVGYSNGMYGLCLIAAWLLVGVSISIEQHHRIGQTALVTAFTSALALGGATVATCMAVLSQSRGGLVATFVALLVSLVAFARPGALAWRVAVIGVATLAASSRLGEPFTAHGKLADAEFFHTGVGAARTAAIDATHEAGMAALLAGGAVLLLVLTMTLVLVEMRLQRPHPQRYASPAPLAAFVGGLVALALVAAAIDGRALHWAGKQWDACRDPQVRAAPRGKADSHFGDVGTNRCDFYRVGLRAFRHSPALGVGAGNFQGEYVRARRSHESPRHAHSLPLQLLAELGVVGLLLGLALVATVGSAGIAFMRAGPLRDPAVAGVVVALVQWGAHSSLDWLWHLPLVTLPVCVLAGALVAGVQPTTRFVRHGTSRVAAAGVVVVALVAIAPVLAADRLLFAATDPDATPERALRDAERAERIDPLWARPPLVQAQLLLEHGTKEDAADAATRAIDAEPGNWAVQWQAAAILQPTDPAAARTARATALSLNPQARDLDDPFHDPANETGDSARSTRPGDVAGSFA